MVRWGLIGVGTIGREWMAAAIANQPESALVAVASSDPGRAEAFAAERGILKAHATVSGLLHDDDIDAVYISTTNERHKSQTLDAAAAGKHVLCEKPLALNLADAQEMVAACRAANVVMGTNHHLRNSATHRKLRELVAAGAVGHVQAARVFHAVFLPPHVQGWRVTAPDAGGGVIFDITVHDADSVRFILNDDVQEVAAMTANQGMATSDLEDTVMGVMRMHGGALVQFHDAFTAKHPYTGLEIHGSEGSLYGRDIMTQRPVGTITLRREGVEELVEVEHENLYERSVRQFNAAIHGEGEPAATAEDGVKSLAVALAVKEAARTGCTVAVATI